MKPFLHCFKSNTTVLMDFYLTVLSDLPEVQTALFMVILNLSLLDILCPTVIVPKMLQIFLSKDKKISFVGCVLQLFFLLDVLGTEIFLLAVMAYDRYVAICSPLYQGLGTTALHYATIMNKRWCIQLMAGIWLLGLINSMIHTSLTFRMSFCGFKKLNQYFCDLHPVMALSCSSTYLVEVVHLLVAGIIGSGAFLVTLISYIYITSTILRMASTEGRHKAFSTCGSHLIVVCLFYGATIATYARPNSSYSGKQGRIISMLYGIITPMLNPMIYSLRNKEVKKALLCHTGRRMQNVCKKDTADENKVFSAPPVCCMARRVSKGGKNLHLNRAEFRTLESERTRGEGRRRRRFGIVDAPRKPSGWERMGGGE
uniref:Olfactory receptor n=1 Tax=Laticauda laticaudata TaxID=8630 RepID=A0A8C5SPN1_LATLA